MVINVLYIVGFGFYYNVCFGFELFVSSVEIRNFDFRLLRNCFCTHPVRFYIFVCFETLT